MKNSWTLLWERKGPANSGYVSHTLAHTNPLVGAHCLSLIHTYTAALLCEWPSVQNAKRHTHTHTLIPILALCKNDTGISGSDVLLDLRWCLYVFACAYMCFSTCFCMFLTFNCPHVYVMKHKIKHHACSGTLMTHLLKLKEMSHHGKASFTHTWETYMNFQHLQSSSCIHKPDFTRLPRLRSCQTRL